MTPKGLIGLPKPWMVVVTNGQPHIGRQVEVQVQSLLQTGAGIIVFAEVRPDFVPKSDTAFITK